MRNYLLVFPVALACFISSSCGGDDDSGSGDDDDTVAVDDDDVSTTQDDDASDDDILDDDISGNDDEIGDDDNSSDDDDVTAPVASVELAIDCTSSKEEVYQTPADLEPFDQSQRGAIVRCATLSEADVDEVTDRLSAVEGVTASYGFKSYLVSYRTEREPGKEGLGTAVIYLPDPPAADGLPMVVANHGTAGLADFCAPSKFETAADMNDLKLPWVVSGFPVVAPDYAGLGTDGVQGYGNVADTGHSVIDAARALKNAVSEGALDGSTVLVGHSQGGGASLSGMAIWKTYAEPDLKLSAVVPFAGSYPKNNSAYAVLVPNVPISGGAGVTRVVLALALYADFANMFGESRAGEPLHPDLRDYMVEEINNKCVFQLVESFVQDAPGYTVPMTLADILDPDFMAEVDSCVRMQGCSERAEAYFQRGEDNIIPIETEAPLLIIGGENDVQNPPEKQSCLFEQLTDYGLEPQGCLFSGQDHMTIVEASVGFAIEWVKGALEGNKIDCPEQLAYPECAN